MEMETKTEMEIKMEMEKQQRWWGGREEAQRRVSVSSPTNGCVPVRTDNNLAKAALEKDTNNNNNNNNNNADAEPNYLQVLDISRCCGAEKKIKRRTSGSSAKRSYPLQSHLY